MTVLVVPVASNWVESPPIPLLRVTVISGGGVVVVVVVGGGVVVDVVVVVSWGCKTKLSILSEEGVGLGRNWMVFPSVC